MVLVILGYIFAIIGIIQLFSFDILSAIFSFLIASSYFLINDKFETLETQMTRRSDSITKLRSKIVRLENQFQEHIEDVHGIGKDSDGVRMICSTCKKEENLTKCTYCNRYFCDNHDPIHILEDCPTHPDYDPDWQ